MKRGIVCARLAFVHTEKRKVSAKIKDIEFFLIFSVEQSAAQARASANHLPELCLTHNLFEKYKVKHLGYIYTRVEHIDRNRDLRHFLRIRKIVNQALRIIDFIVYHLGESVLKVRIFLVENFKDFFRVAVVLCKNNSLADFLTVHIVPIV